MARRGFQYAPATPVNNLPPDPFLVRQQRWDLICHCRRIEREPG